MLITHNASPMLLKNIKFDLFPLDSTLGVRFANEDARREAMKLFEYRCRIEGCVKAGSAFTSLWDLEMHLWHKHWRQFCRTCLHGRPAFVCEQAVYSNRDIERHCREGDEAPTQGGGGAPPVPPHPLCEFCNKRMFDEDELMYHMNERHHICHICGHMGRHNEFYANFQCLEAHYMESHFVCAHPDCAHGGFRLTAFATDEERTLHMLKQHSDTTRLSEKEKKDLARPLLQVGVRSFHEERSQNNASSSSQGGKSGGKGRNAGSGRIGIRFCWPPGITNADLEKSRKEEWADQDDEKKRYPQREVLSDYDNEEEKEEKGGKQQGESANDADKGEQQEQAEEEDEDDDEEESGDDDDDAGGLDPRIRNLSLEATVALSGRHQGMRCCLDALHAVLRAFRIEVKEMRANVPILREAVGRLTLVDIESLERVRKDLDSGALSAECDWEPLERILSLRPLFFRLLRSAVGGGSSGPIGPKTGGGGGGRADDPSESNWFTWRLAAQAAIVALGDREQQGLWIYVDMCMKRRADLSRHGLRNDDDVAEHYPTLGGGPARPAPTPTAGKEESPEGLDDAQSFPTLGGGPTATTDGPGSGWGRPKKQAPPKVGAAGPGNYDVGAEAFPSLGPAGAPRAEPTWVGGGSSSSSKAKSKPAASAPSKSFASKAAAPGPSKAKTVIGSISTTSAAPKPSVAPSKPKPPPKAQPPPAEAFPTLGGAAAADAKSWAAQARERAAKAAAPKPAEPPAPKKPAIFNAAEELFPDLPLGAPKPKSATSKAAARASLLAKAKAAGAKARAAAVPDNWEEDEQEQEKFEEVKEEELIIVHNPLDAVAASEAAQMERKIQKVKGKKSSSSRKGAINPWTAPCR